MFVVGLTGGIGSGKTAATNAFKQLGITIVDADVVAREVVEPGSPALAKIAAHFGDAILLADGQLDRAALRERIFNNADEKKWLEALLHPLIHAETARQLKAANSAYVIYVSPLLIDGGQQQFCQRIVVVDVPEEQQITRTMSRDGNDRALVEKILASQINRQIRLAAASDIIDNSGDLNQLNTQVEQLHLQFLQLAKQEAQ
ncbi:dephospho-CoA kinase [Spongiibacter sp. IMCC21906]|uniref:dephospho-CoA kinase n=1 Tax=Spongiibacter sp. IMCC21906 TaxID=1620392 RepID=UPI00062E09D1|nr:dephospho-CoA kinase [Spongiibacter sp. IMCC21906]AKH68907.1 dephospho-CoA kinase [Spongiibacter sp. IMCC21906]